MAAHGVVISGVGTVSSLAIETARHFERLVAGEASLVPLDGREYRNYPGVLLARVEELDRRKLIPHRMLRKLLSRSAALALVAGSNALRDAGMPAGDSSLRDCGLYVGSVCLDVNPEAFIPALRESINAENRVDLGRFAKYGMAQIDPLFLVKSLPNAGLCGLAIQEQVLGPNANLTNGTLSGIQAVIMAAAAIRRGEVDFALAGGYDTLLQLDTIVEHLLAGNLSERVDEPATACRAFCEDRDGMALGEGAAFVVLESAERAAQHGRPVYGELTSSAQRTAAANLLARNGDATKGDSLAGAASAAMAAAGVGPGDIDVVFGDGLARADHDARELDAAGRVFGERAPRYTAAAGAIGFTGAASGVFSLAHACLAMRDGAVPPLLNCERAIAPSSLDFVREASRGPFDRALVWNDDRGIKSAAIVVERQRN